MKKLFALLLCLALVLAAGCAGIAPAPEQTAETPANNDSPQISDRPAEKDGESGAGLGDAPDFTLTNANGEDVAISDIFSGKPMIINIWATWCPPCVGELPFFDEAYATYGDRVDFVMISVDDNAATAFDFATAKGYSFPVYFDAYYGASAAYNVSAIPTTAVIDAEGNVYTTQVGSYNEDALNALLTELAG